MKIKLLIATLLIASFPIMLCSCDGEDDCIEEYNKQAINKALPGTNYPISDC
ncbi:MAG: hypothetical protein IJ213_07525 [Bacteroidales bacterium]|nr:hypothetical protein [Bacteroidales bacterium]MBQ9312877.1 hypothetical protein [Bacteroidales bacterium]